MAHIRQSPPDSAFGVQVRVLNLLALVPSLLGSGTARKVGVEAAGADVNAKQTGHI